MYSKKQKTKKQNTKKQCDLQIDKSQVLLNADKLTLCVKLLPTTQSEWAKCLVKKNRNNEKY